MNTIINVLLTGASGTVGTEVLHQLAPYENIRLTVFDVKNRRTSTLFKRYKNVNVIYGNLSHENDIQRIPENLDAVIHLAAIIPPRADEQPGLTYKVNVLGTKLLLNQLERTSPDAFLLYSSSISVYGDRVNNPYITVADPLLPSDNDKYAESKINAEKLIQNSKLSWAIFRLAAIMKNHKISKLMFHMPLTTLLEICTPADTAKAFVEGIRQREQLSGKIFNLGGGERCCISYREFLQRSFQLFGLGKLNFPAYAFAMRNFHCGMLADGDILNNILHFRQDTMESYFAQTEQSIPLIMKIFGFIFRIPIKRSLLKKSEPYQAVKTNNLNLMHHFFWHYNFEAEIS
jgi:nucleoside-diphosphate-sugar epimerase